MAQEKQYLWESCDFVCFFSGNMMMIKHEIWGDRVVLRCGSGICSMKRFEFGWFAETENMQDAPPTWWCKRVRWQVKMKMEDDTEPSHADVAQWIDLECARRTAPLLQVLSKPLYRAACLVATYGEGFWAHSELHLVGWQGPLHIVR